MMNLKINSKLFPTNFLATHKDYILPQITIENNKDYCAEERKIQQLEKNNKEFSFNFTKYQEFIGDVLTDDNSGIDSLMLFHLMGSGKTYSAINFINRQYHKNKNFVVFLLIKGTHKFDPWVVGFERALDRDMLAQIKKGQKYIYFIEYDSLGAEVNLLDAMKMSDPNFLWIFISDEFHNWIRVVHNNEKKKGANQKAVNMYYHIQNRKKIKPETKILLMSGTPIDKNPYELVYAYNLLRPNPSPFPLSEQQFNELFVLRGDFPTFNNMRKNLFIRRIMKLTSYYYGGTPDFYPKKIKINCKVIMSKYQYQTYFHFSKIEEKYEKKYERKNIQNRSNKKSGGIFKTFTKQSSLFVIPPISNIINGITRPRLSQMKLSLKEYNQIIIDVNTGEEKIQNLQSQYQNELKKIYENVANYFFELKSKSSDINIDLENFKNSKNPDWENNFYGFFTNVQIYKKLSKLTKKMYEFSPKYVAAIFHAYALGNKAMFFVPYVFGEGIETLRIYLQLANYNHYKKNNLEKSNGTFCEYFGGQEQSEREKIRIMYNDKNNARGEICKFILLSRVGIEAITLKNTIQCHQLCYDWKDITSDQLIARIIRKCSLEDLPLAERVVYHFTYVCDRMHAGEIDPLIDIINLKLDTEDKYIESTDSYMERLEITSRNSKRSFLDLLQEASIDCALFKNHNIYNDTGLRPCFDFNRETIISDNPGIAFRDDFNSDKYFDSGLWANDSVREKIKIYAIDYVFESNGSYSVSQKGYIDKNSGIVYDADLDFVVGKAESQNNHFVRLKNGTFIIKKNETK